MPSPAPSLKQKAHALIDQLPDTVGWQELIEGMRFRQAVEAGIAEADAGQFGSPDAVRAVFFQHGATLEA